jgi:hypothetical protein
MKNYNSVFYCDGFSINHDRRDASDITAEDMIKVIQELCENIRESGDWKPWME